MVSQHFAHDHKDLVHDIAFDFYGRRFATCSSDQSVKVYDKTEDGSFKCTASWKTHFGSVWKVTWAHPDFGQVIATCSFDRTAAIWEEVNTVTDATISDKNQTHWVKRATLVDSRSSVTDVKFAPKHLGLLLATCSADGCIRVYEAPDVMNLSSWPVRDDFACKMSCSSLSWNSSRIRAPMIAVGSDDPNHMGTKVQVFEYYEPGRKWFKSDMTITVLDRVYDLAFAPNIGRTFDILAVASRNLVIFSIRQLTPAGQSGNQSAQTAPLLAGDVTPYGPKYEVISTLDSPDHNGQHIWRVSWNMTGTVLASSGEDGIVKIWRANHLNTWQCIGNLASDPPPTSC